MSDIYFNDWASPNFLNKHGQDALIRDFGIEEAALDGVEVLLASYTYEHYSGSALVVFRKDGKLYEVNGSHCSCYGLEGQWEPEETSVEALRKGDNYRYEECEMEMGALLERLSRDDTQQSEKA